MKYLMLVLFYFLTTIIFCQKIEERGSVFNSNSDLRIGLEIIAFKGLSINQKNGHQILQSHTLPSIGINIGYPVIATNNWLVNMGAGIGYSPINLSYKTDDLDNHTVYYSNGEQYDLEINEFENMYLGTGYINLNLNILKYFRIHKKNQFIIGGGFSLFRGIRDFSEGGSFGQDELSPDSESASYTIFEASIDSDTVSLSWKPSLNLQVGKSFGERIEIFVNFNYSMKPWFSGAYYFYNLGFSSNGTYRKDFSYFGAQIIYSLPLKRK